MMGEGENRSETLLDLPGEVISQIASYLSLSETLSFLSLHPSLLSLCKTHHNPLTAHVSSLLEAGPPYPALLAKLPSLHLYLPNDGGRLFLPLLVRARPQWILERLEIGRWKESVWQEAYQRRFLKSWKRYKGEDDTWRAVFLRMLGRVEHRNKSCTHEESWTRFLTLHRNGSASINRIYSRLFDPYDIYDEIKHQNNFSDQPTQIRVLLHLTDVRIIAVGVLYDRPTLFVNPHAHLLLHPPLLRAPSALAPPTQMLPIQLDRRASDLGSTRPSADSNEAYFPLVRSLSTTGPEYTSYGLTEGPMPLPSPSLRTTFAKVLPGRPRRSASTGEGSEDAGPSRFSGVLTRARSREDGESRKRAWSFGRNRSGSTTGQVLVSHDEEPPQDTNLSSLPEAPSPHISPTETSIPELEPSESTSTPLIPSQPKTSRRRLPYTPLREPQPAPGYRLYPNYTPTNLDTVIPIVDTRPVHLEERDGAPSISPSTDYIWPDERRMCEIGTDGIPRRWVGPMLLMAQLHPPDHQHPTPPTLDPSFPSEGPNVRLGAQGMYVSLGFEDLEGIAPWIELKGGGGNSGDARRGGLGFDSADQ
ncbi:hypothetical protein BCR39DRAFT_513984 [Naematelia encephala]|uniref:F-box domain-containing protein n=1 Tax=Naematelia encephala TaxID=71784 RepID=A0A1Y2BIS0_9TREE|nr:hypothetical protein BCR39DRAFT_513984 [Naematelia encephala]